LIELVISTALMAVILGSAYLCLRAAVASQKLIDTREEVLQNARVAMALLSADLRAACPLSKTIDLLGMHRMLGEVEADNLDFATHNYSPRHLREGDWCEVSYFLDKDAKSGSFSLWRRRDPTPDDEPLAGGNREEIAQNLLGLKFEYYDGFEWFDEWGDVEGRGKQNNSLKERSNLAGLPEAVRITLAFDSNPRATKAAGAESTSPEPPLILQTVARLNLAAAAARSTASASSTNSAAASPSQPGQNPSEMRSP